MIENKRRFERIPFDATVHLTLKSDPSAPVSGVLHDISLKGALIAINETFPVLESGALGALSVRPEQGDFELNFDVEVAYVLEEKRLYGLNVLSLDIDSAGHLRRLVEVNLGDEDSLQRELSNLFEAMEKQHSQD